MTVVSIKHIKPIVIVIVIAIVGIIWAKDEFTLTRSLLNSIKKNIIHKFHAYLSFLCSTYCFQGQ